MVNDKSVNKAQFCLVGQCKPQSINVSSLSTAGCEKKNPDSTIIGGNPQIIVLCIWVTLQILTRVRHHWMNHIIYNSCSALLKLESSPAL